MQPQQLQTLKHALASPAPRVIPELSRFLSARALYPYEVVFPTGGNVTGNDLFQILEGLMNGLGYRQRVTCALEAAESVAHLVVTREANQTLISGLLKMVADLLQQPFYVGEEGYARMPVGQYTASQRDEALRIAYEIFTRLQTIRDTGSFGIPAWDQYADARLIHSGVRDYSTASRFSAFAAVFTGGYTYDVFARGSALLPQLVNMQPERYRGFASLDVLAVVAMACAKGVVAGHYAPYWPLAYDTEQLTPAARDNIAHTLNDWWANCRARLAFRDAQTATTLGPPAPADFESITRQRVSEPLIDERVVARGTIQINWGTFNEPWDWTALQGRIPPLGTNTGGRLVLADPALPAAGLTWFVERGTPKIAHLWTDPELRRRGVMRELLNVYREHVDPTPCIVGPFSPAGRALATAQGIQTVQGVGQYEALKAGLQSPRPRRLPELARLLSARSLFPRDNVFSPNQSGHELADSIANLIWPLSFRLRAKCALEAAESVAHFVVSRETTRGLIPGLLRAAAELLELPFEADAADASGLARIGYAHFPLNRYTSDQQDFVYEHAYRLLGRIQTIQDSNAFGTRAWPEIEADREQGASRFAAISALLAAVYVYRYIAAGTSRLPVNRGIPNVPGLDAPTGAVVAMTCARATIAGQFIPWWPLRSTDTYPVVARSLNEWWQNCQARFAFRDAREATVQGPATQGAVPPEQQNTQPARALHDAIHKAVRALKWAPHDQWQARYNAMREASDRYKAAVAALRNRLPFPTAVGYAYSPRENVGSRGAYHILIGGDAPVQFGRWRRQPGDPLCKPRAKFWGISETDEEATCLACAERAEKILPALEPPAQSPTATVQGTLWRPPVRQQVVPLPFPQQIYRWLGNQRVESFPEIAQAIGRGLQQHSTATPFEISQWFGVPLPIARWADHRAVAAFGPGGQGEQWFVQTLAADMQAHTAAFIAQAPEVTAVHLFERTAKWALDTRHEWEGQRRQIDEFADLLKRIVETGAEGLESPTIPATYDELATGWNVRYPDSFYAMGPYTFDQPTAAVEVAEIAREQFGSYPSEIYPEGRTESTEPYVVPLHSPLLDEVRHAAQWFDCEEAAGYEPGSTEAAACNVVAVCNALQAGDPVSPLIADAVQTILDQYRPDANAHERWFHLLRRVWLPVSRATTLTTQGVPPVPQQHTVGSATAARMPRRRRLDLTGDRPLRIVEARRLARWWRSHGWNVELVWVRPGWFQVVASSPDGPRTVHGSQTTSAQTTAERLVAIPDDAAFLTAWAATWPDFPSTVERERPPLTKMIDLSERLQRLQVTDPWYLCPYCGNDAFEGLRLVLGDPLPRTTQRRGPQIVHTDYGHQWVDYMPCCYSRRDEVEHYGWEESFGVSPEQVVSTIFGIPVKRIYYRLDEDETPDSLFRCDLDVVAPGELTKDALSFKSPAGFQARVFSAVEAEHAHLPYTKHGWKFGVEVWNGNVRVGVAVVENPTARMTMQQHPDWLEITRVCTWGDERLRKMAATKLYAAVAKQAKQLRYRVRASEQQLADHTTGEEWTDAKGVRRRHDGKYLERWNPYTERWEPVTDRYRRLITYTLEHESGTSLKAAGFTRTVQSAGGKHTRAGRKRRDVETGMKWRWEKAI